MYARARENSAHFPHSFDANMLACSVYSAGLNVITSIANVSQCSAGSQIK